MTLIDTAGAHVQLFDNAPLLTNAGVYHRFHDFRDGGQDVSSSITEVGLIVPSQEAIELFNGSRPWERDYEPLFPGDSTDFEPLITDIDDALMRLVMADVERCGLSGYASSAIIAGYFDEFHRQGLHHDNDDAPAVKYNWAEGLGATEGAEGLVKKGDFDEFGILRPDKVDVPGAKLHSQPKSPPGTVTRFMTIGDAHKTPDGIGNRILAQVVWTIS